MSGKFRFAAVISHPIQHYSPIFARLHADPGVEVRALYLTDHGVRESFDPGFQASFAWDVDLLAGHDHRFLRPGFTPRRFGFWELDSPAIRKELDEFAPHAMWLHGYGSRVNWRALSWAQRRAAVIYFGDSELVHPRGSLKTALKGALLPRFFSRCDAFVTIGDNNEAYYRTYGVPESRLFRGACPIDVPRFAKGAADLDPQRRRELRARFGIPPEGFVVVTSGKLEPRKRPLDVVEAVAALADGEGREVHALMIGEGVLREQIVQRAQSLGVADRVHVTGFVNQSELPTLVAGGDLLVMASEMDPHPLAVSEALPAGLPVVASDRIGCVGPTDTARPGGNATVYPSGDVPALVAAIRALESDAALYRRYSEASRTIAGTQDFQCAADAVLRAVAALRGRFAGQWAEVDGSHFERWNGLAVTGHGDVEGLK